MSWRRKVVGARFWPALFSGWKMIGQGRGWEQVLAGLFLLLEDDLGKYGAGDVVAGLGVVDQEIFAVLDHGGEVFQRHVSARPGVIEPAVRVFLDGGGLV